MSHEFPKYRILDLWTKWRARHVEDIQLRVFELTQNFLQKLHVCIYNFTTANDENLFKYQSIVVAAMDMRYSLRHLGPIHLDNQLWRKINKMLAKVLACAGSRPPTNVVMWYHRLCGCKRNLVDELTSYRKSLISTFIAEEVHGSRKTKSGVFRVVSRKMRKKMQF